MASHRAPPCIIDIEASGFGAQSYPIELGVALACGRRESMLVRPEPDWIHWQASAEALHGLSRDLLMQNGKSVQEVASIFNELLNGQTVYSDGWVVDKPWISELFHKARVPMAFGVSPIELIMIEAQFEIWDVTKQQVTAELQATRHRASTDALIIQQTFVRTQDQSGEQRSVGPMSMTG